jgi:hypothetical protein
MYIGYNLGEKLTVVSAGKLRPEFAVPVSEIKASLLSTKTNSKMGTFLIHYMDTDTGPSIHTIWVAISGSGNKHKSDECARRLTRLSYARFVPYVVEGALLETSKPSGVDFISAREQLNRENLFKRFLIFITNAFQADGSSYDATVIKEVFHLKECLIDSVRFIKAFLRSEAFKAEYLRFLTNPAEKDYYRFYPTPVHFLLMLAWECYLLDRHVQESKKSFSAHGGFIKFIDTVTGFEVDDINYRKMKTYIQALELERDDQLYKSFEALWQHMNQFKLEQLTRKMQHCAETNLIEYLQTKEGRKILGRPGKFYLFSSIIGDDTNEIVLLCDNCRLSVLPKIKELNIAAGDSPKTMYTAQVPVISASFPTLPLALLPVEELCDLRPPLKRDELATAMTLYEVLCTHADGESLIDYMA